MTGSEAVSERSSLYDRLGGVYSIATVVEDLIDQIMVDPRLNANPRVDEAHHKVPPAGFKYLVTEMLCGAAGGPQRYSGRSMEESHRDMAITPGEWQAFMDDLQMTLDKFSVPAAEQAEVKALVERHACRDCRAGCVGVLALPHRAKTTRLSHHDRDPNGLTCRGCLELPGW